MSVTPAFRQLPGGNGDEINSALPGWQLRVGDGVGAVAVGGMTITWLVREVAPSACTFGQ